MYKSLKRVIATILVITLLPIADFQTAFAANVSTYEVSGNEEIVVGGNAEVSGNEEDISGGDETVSDAEEEIVIVEMELSVGIYEKATSTLDWEEVEEASYYEIYRGEELLGTTEEVMYKDSTISADNDYEYRVVAYNEEGNVIGEGSDTLEVPANMTLTSQTLTLTENTEVFNLTSAKSTINLNGYTLTVYGDMALNESSTFIMNQGACYCYGYFNVGTYSTVNMSKTNDYLLVYGDTVWNNSSSSYNTLTNGVLEVKGDFYQQKYASFVASSYHKLILSGLNEQTIYAPLAGTKFNVIELQNYSKEGVKAQSAIVYNEIITNDCRFTNGNEGGVYGFTLEEDLVVENMYLISGTMDLNGHTLTVSGNLEQANGQILVNGGRLIVEGDYYQRSKTISDSGTVTYGKSTGLLVMQNEADYVRVKGNFIAETAANTNGYLTNGIMELQGNFEQKSTYSAYSFCATENHTIVLSGEGNQKITVAYNNENSYINHLIVKDRKDTNVILQGNPYAIGVVTDEGDDVQGYLKTRTMKFTDGWFSGSIYIRSPYNSISSDLHIGGSMTVEYFVQIYSDVIVEQNVGFGRKGKIDMQKGSLIIKGNYNCPYKDSNYQLMYTYGLMMTHVEDYVCVEGNFVTDHYQKMQMTAGTLELKGNVTAYKAMTFSGTHKTILSGDKLQTVNLCSGSTFATLELQNYSEEGVYSASAIPKAKLIHNGCKLKYGDMDGVFGWILEEDTVIEGDLLLIEDVLDLNGYSLTVIGNVIQAGGEIRINNGKLYVEGDYRQQSRSGTEGSYSYGRSAGLLTMRNEADYVLVKGNYVTETSMNTYGYLTHGTLELQGNFEQKSTYSANSFCASGNHTIVLSGEREQKITVAGNNEKSYICHLTIRDREDGKVILQGNPLVTGKIVDEGDDTQGYLKVRTPQFPEGWFSGSLYIYNPYKSAFNCDLHIGGSLLVEDIVYIYSNVIVEKDIGFKRYGKAEMQKGSLIVRGNYSCQFTENGSRLDAYGVVMTHAEDYVCIEGNYMTYHEYNPQMTAGTLELKGNVTAHRTLVMSGTHKTVLSGDKLQTVNLCSGSTFATLELQNYSEEGVYSATAIPKTKLVRNGCNLTYGDMDGVFGWTLEEDIIIEGDLLLIEDVLDLNGYSLTVTGNLIQAGGEVRINNGKLYVEGDYRQQSRSGTEGSYTYGRSAGILTMQNEADYVLVKGNFIAETAANTNGYLTNGTLELQGNFEQKSTYSANSFCASGNHTMVLSGEGNQKITVAYDNEASRINHLIIRDREEAKVTLQGNPYAVGVVTDEGDDVQGYLKTRTMKFNDGWFSGSLYIRDPYNSISSALHIGGSLTVGYYVQIYSDVIVEQNVSFGRYGKIDMQKGSLIIKGNYNCPYRDSDNQCMYTYGLVMTHAEDYVCVEGNFVTAHYQRMQMTAGTLELKGNVTANKALTFSGTHKTILSGDKQQTVNLCSGSTFATLELQNYSAEGVYSSNVIPKAKLIPNGCRLRYGNMEGVFGWTLTDDYVAEGDFILMDGILDLNGHTLTVKGDLLQPSGSIRVNGGELIVEGDYRLQFRNGTEGAYTYSTSVGSFVMQSEEDRVTVHGDFVMNVNHSVTAQLTNGTLEVKGNVTQGGGYAFATGANHQLLLSGEEVQTIKGAAAFTVGKLTLDNPSGVTISTNITAQGSVEDKQQNMTGSGILYIKTMSQLTGDWGGNLALTAQSTFTRDLKVGGTLTVSGITYLDKYTVNAPNIVLNAACYVQDGTIYCSNNMTVNSAGKLIMQSDAGYVQVVGNFAMNASSSHSGLLTAGTMELKGDFTQGTAANFIASEEHKVILARKKGNNGREYIQTISFAHPGTARFNKLVLTKQEDLYQFRNPIEDICNELIYELEDIVAPTEVTTLKVVSRDVTQITISYDGAEDNYKVAGYEIYRDGAFVGVTSEKRFTDYGLTPDTEYVYSVYAYDEYKNRAEDSKELTVSTLPDETAPEAPNAPVIATKTGSSITLKWNRPYDNVEVVSYRIYRDDRLLAEGITEQSYKDTDVRQNVLYEYRLEAVDATGNVSERSGQTVAYVSMPKITKVTPADYAKVSGDTITVQVYFKDFGNSTGNKVKIEYYDSKGELQLAAPTLLGQKRYDANTLYVSYDWNVENLTGMQEYNLHITLYDSDNNEDVVDVTYFTDKEAPKVVQGFAAEAKDQVVSLSWDASESADCATYRIYKKAGEEETYQKLATVNGRYTTAYTDRTASAGEQLTYVITAVDAYGNESEYCEAVSVTVDEDLSAPEITKITPNAGRINKTVTLVTEARDNLGVDTIRLFYAAEGEEEFIPLGEIKTTGNKASYSWDTTALEDGIYIVRATAFDKAGNESVEVYERRYEIDNTGIAQIQITKTEIGSSMVQLHFADVEESDFSYFAIEQKSGETFKRIGTVSNTLGYSVTGLKPLTNYTFRVVGYDNLGNRGIESEECTLTTIEDTIAPAITAVYPVASSYKGTIQLKVTAKDNAGIDRAVFAVSTDKVNFEEVATVSASGKRTEETLAYTLNTDSYEEGSIYVRFQVYDIGDNKNALLQNGEEIISEYVIDRTAPEAVTGTKAVGEFGYIEVSWDVSGNDVAFFNIYRADSNQENYQLYAKNVRTRNYYDTGVKQGETFFYKVSGIDIAGNEGEPSEAAGATAKKDTVAPLIRGMVPGAGGKIGTNATLKAVATDNSALKTVVFEYRPKDSTEDIWQEIGEKKADGRSSMVELVWNTEGLTEGDYEIRSYAMDAVGNISDYYTTWCVLDLTAPERPLVEVTSKSFSIGVDVSGGDEEDFSHFEIYRKEVGTDTYEKVTSLLPGEYTDKAVSTDAMYYYKVRSYDTQGNYSESAIYYSYADDKDTEAPNAVLSENMAGLTGMEIAFDGTASTDNVRVSRFEWNMGDGTKLYGAQPIHTYEEPGVYIVTLTVTDTAGNTDSTTCTVNVLEKTGNGKAEVTIRDKQGNPIPHALVYVQLEGEDKLSLKADANGKVTIATKEGVYNVAAYKAGFLPAEKMVRISQYEDNKDTITLETGEVVVGSLEVHKMELEEMIEAGVDFSNPSNYASHRFVVSLTFAQRPLPIVVEYTNAEEVEERVIEYESGGGKGSVIVKPIGGVSGTSGEGNIELPSEEPILAYVHTDETITWLKEMYSVTLGVLNTADSGFDLKNCRATLNLPDGLSLAALTNEQNLITDMGTIKGQQEKSTSWIVRGDKSGSYKLTADFTGLLQPFDSFVSVRFETEKEFQVALGEGLHLEVFPESRGYIGEAYYIHYRLTNNSDRTIYKLKTTFEPYRVVPRREEVVLKFPNPEDTSQWKYETIPMSEFTPDIVVPTSTNIDTFPLMQWGEKVEVAIFAPGTSLLGTYMCFFDGEGDMDEIYYELIECVISSWEETGLEITANVIPSHIYKAQYQTGELSASYGDPIDVASGAFTEEINLMELADSPALGIKLYYNSLAINGRGQTGYGWHHNMESKLTDSQGIISLSLEPEKEITFISQEMLDGVIYGELIGDKIILNENAPYYGKYVPLAEGMDGYRINKNENGTYLLTLPDESTQLFNANGQVIQITDSIGNAITFENSESQTVITEQITGRSIILHYNNEGLLTIVEDDKGRKACLAYTNDMISSVTNVLGETTTFTYSDRRLTKATGANGITYVTNIYDAQGRVISQSDATGSPASTLSYEDTEEGTQITIVDHNGNTIRFLADDNGNILSKTDALGATLRFTYDQNNRLVAEKDAYENMRFYEYDENGNMIVAIDELNNKTYMKYDANDNPIQIIAGDGTAVNYTYNDRGLLATEKSASGAITRYTYDSGGHLIRKETEGLGTESYCYEKGRLISTTDKNGNTTTFAYDEYGNKTSQVDANGNTTTYAYDLAGRLTGVYYPNGTAATYTYDCNGNLTSTKDCNGNITRYEYNGNGWQTKAILPDGNTEQYFYDGEGNKTKIIFADGTEETAEYDANGNLIKNALPTGETYTYTYDLNGRLISETDPDGVTITHSYYDNGKVYKDIYSDGRSVLYSYDSRWRLVRKTNGEGNSVSYTYDAKGNLTGANDALGNEVRNTYDAYNRLTAQTDANGNVTTYRYDANGNCIAKENAEGQQIHMEYNKLGQVTEVRTFYNGESLDVRYTYDEMGNKTSYTDEEGYVTRWTYDGMGNMLTETDANGNTTTYTYDAFGNPLTVTDALGRTTACTYDKDGNLIQAIRNADTGMEQITAYSYDAMGRLLSVTDAEEGNSSYTYTTAGRVNTMTDAMGGVTTYGYDTSGRVTEEVNAIGARTSYTYNALGLLEQVTENSGQATTYEYDSIGRIKSMTDEEGMVTYTYDANGNILTVTDENGTIERTYDNMNRVATYTDYKGNTVEYGYDELGNRISLTYPGGEIVRYTYYKNGRLKTVTDWEGRVTAYEYDGVGNLTKTSHSNGVTEENTYNKVGNLVVRVQKKDEEVIERTEYTYDAAGNITVVSKSNATTEDKSVLKNAVMTYDEDNRLLTYNREEIKYDADGNMTYGPLNGVMTELRYDSRNRLIKAGETTYEYDAENNRIAVETKEYRDEYVIDVESTYSQMLLAERTYTDGRVEVSKYVYGNGLIGEEKTTEDGKEYATYLYNHLGSTTAVTDGNGAVIETYDYGAYGELLTDNIGARRFLYNGQLGVTSDDNGLYHMRARYYNTDIKRFISRDIVSGDITNSQSLNRYCYVQGNPLSYIDPFGLSPQSGWSLLGHSILMLVGIFPGAGAVPDLINCVWYGIEGNGTESVLSFLSAFCEIGNLVGAGKMAKNLSPMLKKLVYMTGKAANLALSGINATISSINLYNQTTGKPYEGNAFTNSAVLVLSLIMGGLTVKGLINIRALRGLDDATPTVGGKTGGVKGGTVPKGTLTGKLDGLTADERGMVEDLLSSGKNVEIIPRSDTGKTPDFFVDGVKTELKTLNGSSLNTPVTRIEDGFEQGAEVVIIDGRKTGLTLEQAETVIVRALGKYDGELPGIVEIWTKEGIVRR